MFLPCPNCGFLVARVAPRRAGTVQHCPRCGLALPLDDGAAGDDGAANEAAIPHRHDAGSGPRRTRPGTSGTPDARAGTGPIGGGAAVAPERDRSTASAHDAASADRPAGRSAHPPAQAASEATPVIVHAQPDPPPAAHVHTASPMAQGAPSFVRAPARVRPPRRRWPLHAGIAALALVLALQLVLAQREVLAAHARWRPAVETLCGVLGCAVPAWREPSAFTMIDRSVQPKPGAAGVLTARASFRNDARWPQPWPTLVLTLSDVDGAPLGRRAFSPDEYAGADARTLMPGQSASVQLDVVEPAPGVVAYAFDFR